LNLPKGFFVSVNQGSDTWPASFKIFTSVYFPPSYEALDPKLSWYQCHVLSPSDDLQLPGLGLPRTSNP
jgi:hypothetical protein